MKTDWKRLKAFFMLFRQQWIPYGISTIMVACRNLLITYFTAYISSRVISKVADKDIQFFHELLLFLILLLSFVIFDSVSRYIQSTVQHKIMNGIRSRIFEHTINMAVPDMERMGERSELIARINQDVDTAASMLNSLLLPLMYIISGVGATATIITKSPELCLGLYVTGFVALYAQTRISKRVRKNSTLIRENTTEELSLYLQSLPKAAEIRMSNLSGYIWQLFKKRMSAVKNLSIDSGKALGIYGGIQGIVSFLAFFGVIGYGMISRRLALADIVLLSQMAPLVCTMILSVSTAIANMNNAMVGIDRIQELLDLPEENLEGLPFENRDINVLVKAQNLGCSFPNGNVAFRNLNLSIPAGQTVAIRGESGNGKTTLMRLVLGIYPYTEGSLKLMGQEIGACTKKSVREQIAYVPQKNIIYPGTIRENLLLGNGRAIVSEKEITEVLKLVGALEWVMDYGLDVRLPEGGMNLSGGQRQMIAIARAILYRRPIMIMDEAFAGIDEQRIERIMKNMKHLQYTPSVIIVSHDSRVIDACHTVVRLMK